MPGGVDLAPAPPVRMYCTCDYRTIEGATHADVERLFAAHVDESRDPSEHELVPF